MPNYSQPLLRFYRKGVLAFCFLGKIIRGRLTPSASNGKSQVRSPNSFDDVQSVQRRDEMLVAASGHSEDIDSLSAAAFVNSPRGDRDARVWRMS